MVPGGYHDQPPPVKRGLPLALAIALAQAGFARRSQCAGGAEPFEGSAVHVGFARRSQCAGGAGPSQVPR